MARTGRTVEAICRKHVYVGRGFGRAVKRQTAKLWRRLAKENPEGAPVRRPTRYENC
jgi:hypothetical protein